MHDNTERWHETPVSASLRDANITIVGLFPRGRRRKRATPRATGSARLRRARDACSAVSRKCPNSRTGHVVSLQAEMTSKVQPTVCETRFKGGNMRHTNRLFLTFIVFTLSAFLNTLARAQAVPTEYQDVLKALGKQGDYKSNVFKINIPRNDIKVAVDGVSTPTPFGFGGWLAMTKGDAGQDVMMGDLVLLEDEVNPVMSALLDNGLEVTALHNHFFFEEPRIFYMHVMGHGTPADLARMAKPALDLISHPTPAGAPASSQLDTANIA